MPSVATAVQFSDIERAAIAAHGPWPKAPAKDSSNRLMPTSSVMALGKQLFFDPRLSANGQVSCASCHQPERYFQDGRATAVGLDQGTRNTISLIDSAGQRWFGWGGASDSLWAASLRAILQPHEMGLGAAGAAKLIGQPGRLHQAYVAVFGEPTGDTETTLANLAKALALWQNQLVSPRTVFDDFREALARHDAVAMNRYPASAQRGLRLFVGTGRCHVCHAGPRFSNGEFGNIGLPYFLPGGGVDAGRYRGLQTVKRNPFNRLGKHADDAGTSATMTTHVRGIHRNFGEFKVPSLRGLSHTAPYMHNGSLPTLPDVLRHYNEMDLERLHADGERILRPLGLNAKQLTDLEAFLHSLSTPAQTMDNLPVANPPLPQRQ